MKPILILSLLCGALLLGSCADQSLLTDEEYHARKGPAPHAPDPMQHVPESELTSNRPVGY